jgi:hypothetical protein
MNPVVLGESTGTFEGSAGLSSHDYLTITIDVAVDKG